MFTTEDIKLNIKRLKDEHQVEHVVTDFEARGRLKAGEKIMQDRKATTIEEAWEMLKYHAALVCEYEKNKLLTVNQVASPEVITSYIKSLEREIKEFDQHDIVDANGLFYQRNIDLPAAVYKRLTTGFYERLPFESFPPLNKNSSDQPEAAVYGKYILFYEFLKGLLKKTKPKENSYTLKQVAIACHALSIDITEDNGPAILKQYTTSTSVQKLLTHKVYRAAEVTCLQANKAANTRHMRDLEAAQEIISGKKNKKAKDTITQYITDFKAKVDNLA